jgi:hypothetical protein
MTEVCADDPGYRQLSQAAHHRAYLRACACLAGSARGGSRRPLLLKAYLDRYAREVQRFFPVANGSPIEAFEDLAPRYPVLEAGAQSPLPLREGVRGRGQFQYRCYSCPLPLPEIGRLASGSPIAHSKHSCSARRSRKSANATDRPLVARESRNVRRRRMDRAVSWITARGLPMVHLRAMPLHLFRARS